MAKQKMTARVFAADGAGGMRELEDLRFAEGAWPVAAVVSAADADEWMAHLHAEIEDRSWSADGVSQSEGDENSGTLSVRTGENPSSASFDIVWSRPRRGDLSLRARSTSEPPYPAAAIGELLASIDRRLRLRTKRTAHRWALLTYDGLPWRGEIWLDDNLRLGPPSRFPDSLLGPQIVIVDTIVSGIGWAGVQAAFQSRLAELRVFLAIVLGLRLSPARTSMDWVCDVDTDGSIKDCAVRSIGYVELDARADFPNRGTDPPMERRPVVRPGLGPVGVWPDMHERWAPDDIELLWAAFIGLSGRHRQQLLNAGNAYLIAMSMWPNQRSAFATFLVVACESLKPRGRRHDGMNVYDVVEALLGSESARHLRQLSPPPQRVRSRHVHRGELTAGELIPRLMHDDFADPSFDQMLDALASTTRTCLLEWLRREGRLISAK